MHEIISVADMSLSTGGISLCLSMCVSYGISLCLYEIRINLFGLFPFSKVPMTHNLQSF